MTKKTAAKKKSARKAPAKEPTRVQRKKRELLDDPARRFRELLQDRRFGSEGKNLAELRLAALVEKETLGGGRAMTPIMPGASNWVQLGPTAIPNGQTYGGSRVLVSGRITALVVDPATPSTIYAAAARGGVWKTTDGGQTWTPTSDNARSLAIGTLTMAPSDHSRVYAGTGEGNIFFYAQNFPLNSVNADYHGIGVLRSDDAGATWTNLGQFNLTGAAFYRIAVHPTNPDIVFGATTFGLMRSTDGGASWTQMTNGLPALSTAVIACCDVAFDPADPNRVYCAFFGGGIYRSTNALATNPAWSQLTSGLPSSNVGRIAIRVAPSDPNTLFALYASMSDAFLGIFTTSNKGTNWIQVPASGIQVFGAFTLDIGVDIATTSVIYVCGVELYKGVRTGTTWSFTNVGKHIHPDSHAIAFHPTDNQTIYAGNDGGIYKSTNGGSTWDDSINEGLAITQFEFMGHSTQTDAMILGGTQDNGTEMYRNSPVFYHSADGDGGAAGIDPANPNNCIHTFFGATPHRSTQAGKFGTYASIKAGLSGGSLFYPPWSFDDSNSNRLAFGLGTVKLSNTQGTDNWPGTITLPGIGSARVSAIHYVSANLLYCATSDGKVYKWTGGGSATPISASPLPSRWIWDVQLIPGAIDELVVAMAGYGTSHVWKGKLTGSAWVWTDISGSMFSKLPDAPANSLQIDPAIPGTMYVGTDIGVFRTQDGGANWHLFNHGLPNVAVYDLKLHAGTRILRAATHGRGIWERKLDVTAMQDVRLLVRDNPMDTGRVTPAVSPVPAGWEDPTQQVSLNQPLFWWQSADIKIDAPVGGLYQMPVSAVDYLAFETKLTHRNPQRGALNRVYVQVHNRGATTAHNVEVKAFYADASPGLPDLPADFWTAFPADPAPNAWTSVGPARTISAISPVRPEVAEWDWNLPTSAAQHTCMLVIVRAADDPLTESFQIATLVPGNRQAALKNLHVIDALSPVWQNLKILSRTNADLLQIEGPAGTRIRALIPLGAQSGVDFGNMVRVNLTASEQARLREQLGPAAPRYDTTAAMQSSERAAIKGIPRRPEGVNVLFSFAVPASARSRAVTVTQSSGGRVLGGNTFAL